MTRTYKATGINLKAMPFGETDRLLTILTPEYGLLRVVAPGARKHNSRLGGRSGLFVVNQLLLAKGKSLDKITQAESLASYPGLSRNLSKLTAGQYLAELTLQQALSQHPQADLYYLFTEHLNRIEAVEVSQVLPRLAHGVFQLLALAGVAPQVQQCCVSGRLLEPQFQQPDLQVGFSIEAGGTVSLQAAAQLGYPTVPGGADRGVSLISSPRVCSPPGPYSVDGAPSSQVQASVPAIISPGAAHRPQKRRRVAQELFPVSPIALDLMQQLAQETLPQLSRAQQYSESELQLAWRQIEQMLRQYAQFHFGQPIRSATLIDSYLA
jgi:DNA repair protein RecO (recombination protein O)